MTQRQVTVGTAYIAAAANRFTHISDVCGSYVAYGTSTLLALWDAAVRNKNLSEPLAVNDSY
jgi:hypothetical protein